MISAAELLAESYHRRAHHWHRASLWACVAGVFGTLVAERAWPMWCAFTVSMLLHWQFRRAMDRAQALIGQRIAQLREELWKRGIDPDTEDER